MESQTHINLVNIAAEYIKSIVPEEEHSLIYMDTSGNSNAVRVIGNYIPDVYYSGGGKLVIGEAKTLNDFERKHSKEQFKAYMKEFLLFQGECTLVIGVPWQLVITAKNYFARLRRQMSVDVKVIIINEMSRCFLV